MIKLPKKLKIGGLEYTVLYPYVFDDDPSVSTGLHEAGQNRIKVAEYEDGDKRHPTKILETFLHEVVHAIEFVYGNYELSERFVAVFSRGLTGVLLDNNLKLNEKNFTKLINEVKIGGYKFKVVYPYEFEDTDSFLTSTINTSRLEMRISKANFSPSFIKANLVYCIAIGIYSVYFSNSMEEPDEDCGLNWKAFSQGLYQTIVDNKIEELCRKWRV